MSLPSRLLSLLSRVSPTFRVVADDHERGVYVGFCQAAVEPGGRSWEARPCNSSSLLSPGHRRVGRCEFKSLSDWGCEGERVQTVLRPDERDPPCLDLHVPRFSIE